MEATAKNIVRKFDIDSLGFINLFERLTRCKARDCIIYDDVLYFVVENGYMAKAIGKNASNLKMLEMKFKKKIRMIEYNDNVESFVNSLLYPIRANEIKSRDGKVLVALNDHKSKGIVIGRDRKNLKRLQEILARYFSNIIEIV